MEGKGGREGKNGLGLKPGLRVLLLWHLGLGREKCDSLQGSPCLGALGQVGSVGHFFSEHRLGRSGGMSRMVWATLGPWCICSYSSPGGTVALKHHSLLSHS